MIGSDALERVQPCSSPPSAHKEHRVSWADLNNAIEWPKAVLLQQVGKLKVPGSCCSTHFSKLSMKNLESSFVTNHTTNLGDGDTKFLRAYTYE